MIEIDSNTGRGEYTNLTLSKRYSGNLQLLFTISVDPTASRYEGLEVKSAEFNVSKQLYCLKEIQSAVSPKENQIFTQNPVLQIIDCATGDNISVTLVDTITVTMTTSLSADAPNLAGTLTVTADSSGLVNFPSDIKYITWAINLTVKYYSSEIHQDVSLFNFFLKTS